ncbi:MAG TPA: bifunctional proline dehydrogenase/L-glutamate gamma-semialdehyde dehydrogenase PutA [Gammaproteobacteria bacterium]|nr:bifunctional proline dehydrogenase/L-glutamate gamma-semialdehyde dehydrogenase PutA [Gammaproteobacteria bacterium]
MARDRPWLFDEGHPAVPEVDAAIAARWLADETATVRELAARAALDPERNARVREQSASLVAAIRARQRRAGGVDALLGEYDLSSAEGIVLMCLAEALLRIPDAATADRLIADKLGSADWEAHLGASESLFVNASTWALLLTGRIVGAADVAEPPGPFFARLVERLGEPVVRAALKQAMRILGQQFVMGETIDAALARAAAAPQFDYSFDMLGEAALTAADAERYLAAYAAAIDAVGRSLLRGDGAAASISVKLSALCPRYEPAQGARASRELAARLLELATRAAAVNVELTVDAEEADRLELSLAIFGRVLADPRLGGYEGLGLAVQAYQKRALPVLAWLERLARAGRAGNLLVIPVRLVKGAYWDSEVKHAQELGLDGYPVFTRKSNTDVSYLACAKALLSEHTHLRPQFATHNAHTVAWILEVGAQRTFEFQRLHGMGEELYGELLGRASFGRRCRVYAPVGSHAHLLPYLVRRLLENGANTSFVNRLVHADSPPDSIVADPLAQASAADDLSHPRIPPPRALFAPERANSRGYNLADAREQRALSHALRATTPGAWVAAPRVAGRDRDGDARPSRDPADVSRVVGTVRYSDAATARAALEAASAFQPAWNAVPVEQRAQTLRAAADLFEADAAELAARCIVETGRTVPDALAEVREAVDLLRYYAAQAVRHLAVPTVLPGPTGERNELRLVGRGVFVCISPWNFPLAIFSGQIAAALAAGNTVIAKPAEQGSLVAAHAVRLLGRAGIPDGALQFLPGDGRAIGEVLLHNPRVAGVVFTGSVETAQSISRTLANRPGPLATFIAETGGINAMIVDSSALPEQVVRDAAQSAFNSAGQRCSALRLLCLQEDTADDVLRLLTGWMDELVIGNPAVLATDVGPVIDSDARALLADWVDAHRAAVLHRCRLGAEHERGIFFPPTVIALDRVADLTREVFGPVLHVVRYRARHTEQLVDEINGLGYGLTLGVHTRIDSFARRVAAGARAGNVYVNRNMIGAQVGVQPFGGMGLSGTGPKAGGPHYVPRFAVEQTVTTNTAAVGGNATLLSLAPEIGSVPRVST